MSEKLRSDKVESTPELEGESLEKWALKSKQIEAERLKAVKALADEKPSKANLAFLDPKTTKAKGWSKDPDVIAADIERMGNRALILAVGGIILGAIGFVGGAVLSPDFGLIGSIISGLGLVCIGVAVLLGLVVVGMELYWMIRQKKKLSPAFWAGFSAIAVAALYFIVQKFLFSA